MTPSSPPTRDARPPEMKSSQGLRLRLWLGCLAGAMVGAGGMWWVVGTYAGPDLRLNLPEFISWLTAVAAASMLVGVAFALWLDTGIIGHLRGLTNGLASGRGSDLSGLHAGAGWGELSQLTEQVQAFLTQHHQFARAADEMTRVRTQLEETRAVLERWIDHERWDGARVEPGAVAPLVEALDRGLRRLDDVRDENLEAVQQVGITVNGALAEARETAGEAERGFVEATALLTTVRELQRLSGELEPALGHATDEPETAAALDAWRTGARAAIQELVESSSGSVEHLGRGLLRVREIADQVHLVSNRATLIALNAALAGSRHGQAEPGSAEGSDEMKRLAAEVRQATERTAVLSGEIEGEVAASIEKMRGVRERVGRRLEQLPDLSAPAAAHLAEPPRLLERVREMVQDAAQKGERLSAAGERVSRAAQRLVRRLEEEVQELAGMVVRLSPPEARTGTTSGTPSESAPAPAVAEDAEAAPSRSPGLRLLGEEHLLPGEKPRGPRKRAGGPGPGSGERS